VEKKASEQKPPRRVRRQAVPMKFVTLFAEFEGDMCMHLIIYNTKLFALATNARFSSISATVQTPTHTFTN